MPLAPNITCANSHTVSTPTAAVARRRRDGIEQRQHRTKSVNPALRPRFCLRSALYQRAQAYSPAVARSGFSETVLVENPLFGRCAQLLQFFFTSGLGIYPDHRFSPRKPVTYPGTVLENQLQSVGAHDFDDLAAEEFPRILCCNFSVNFSFTSGVKRKFSRWG